MHGRHFSKDFVSTFCLGKSYGNLLGICVSQSVDTAHNYWTLPVQVLICCLSSPRFFAGGSERSGQQIVGPPKKKSTNEVVEDLFKGAKEHGAVPVEKAGRGPGESSRAKVLLAKCCN